LPAEGPSAISPRQEATVHQYLTIRQFIRSLKNLDAIIEKATKQAEARKYDVNNFCSARLFPDMLPFVVQIRIACDTAKGTAATLAATTPPQHEDNETTVAELRARIAKCVSYLETFRPADFEKVRGDALVKHRDKSIAADEYLFGRQIPNFYFHVVTAYALLRSGGIDIGKADYLGQLAWVEK
jgi:hypothetical protein